MQAKILSVTKNSSDFQFPQIDIQVEYTDKNFIRLYIFTLPYEKFASLDENGLEDMVRVQGKNFKEVLKQGETMDTQETVLKQFVSMVFTI